jgi:hypothetical protein
LASSAYLYFTYNPLNTSVEEEVVDEYEGWNTHTNDDFSLTIKYPSTWVLKDDTKNELYNSLGVSTPANDSDLYDDFVLITALATIPNDTTSLLAYVEKTKVDVESGIDGGGEGGFTFDYELTQKWGKEVYSYTLIEGSEYGPQKGYMLLVRDTIYGITYRDTTGDGNTKKALDSISFWE